MGRKSTIKINDKYGSLLVLDVLPSNISGKHARIKCLCDCGNITLVQSHLLKSKIKSCGCQQFLGQNLINQQYGKMIVLSKLKDNRDCRNHRGHLYLCKCNICNRQYDYQTSSILRKGFCGCHCNSLRPKKEVFRSYCYNAKKRKIKFMISFEEFLDVSEKECFYCGGKPDNKKQSGLLNEWHYNGIDRIDNQLPYIKSNIVPCCKTCNFMKCKLNFVDFIAHIKRICFYTQNIN
jgi:hypothetical protein